MSERIFDGYIGSDSNIPDGLPKASLNQLLDDCLISWGLIANSDPSSEGEFLRWHRARFEYLSGRILTSLKEENDQGRFPTRPQR